MLPRPILRALTDRLDEVHARCRNGDMSPTAAYNCATGLKAGFYALLFFAAAIDAIVIFLGWWLFGGEPNMWLAVAVFAGAALISLIVTRPIFTHIDMLGRGGAANDR